MFDTNSWYIKEAGKQENKIRKGSHYSNTDEKNFETISITLRDFNSIKQNSEVNSAKKRNSDVFDIFIEYFIKCNKDGLKD